MLRLLEVFGTPGAARAWLSWPRFSLASYSILTRLKRAGVAPRTIIDVGANVGQFAVAAMHIFPDAGIFPIEPDANVANILRRNVGPAVGRNVLTTAVGDVEGSATLNVNSDSQVSSLLGLGPDRIKSFPQSNVIETRSVAVTTLDRLFLQRDLAPPLLLKIDVQGYEDRVIRGARLLMDRIEWVVMEVSFAALYQGERRFTDILDLMAGVGFRFVRPLNFHLSPTTGDIIEMDALFEAIPRAIEPQAGEDAVE